MILLAPVLGFLISLGPQPVQGAPPHVREVRGFFDRLEEAFVRKDVSAAIALYAPDFRDENSATGRQSVANVLVALFDSPGDIRLQVDVRSIREEGGYTQVITRTHVESNGTPRALQSHSERRTPHR